TRVGSSYPAFDNNGNTTTDQSGKTFIYDAWNRLVQVKQGSTVLVTYGLDALSRRVKETNGTAKDFYYSAAWQLLEERLNGSANACAQYLWSPVYLDALILRDRDTDPDQPGLEERLYVQQDANWNVTAIANPAGQVLERYVYDPYGKATVYDAGWTGRGVERVFARSYV